MIRNILTVALRILFRNKLFSLINIVGISIGISCALLILTIVRHDLSFDRFHSERQHLFMLEQVLELGTGPFRTDRCGAAVGPALKDAFPEVRDYIRYSLPQEMLLIYDQPDSAGIPRRKKFIENRVLAVDSNFLDHFSFPAVAGNPDIALDDPRSLVMTRETAEKYFGDEDPIGKTIRINRSHHFTVTAVLEDPPENSSIRFGFLIPFDFLEEFGYDLNNYNGNPFYTCLYLEDPGKSEELGKQICEFLDGHMDESVQSEQFLLPLPDFHRKGENRGILVITILSILGIVILGIACINFMNLTTARYLSRTREIGMRKVVGARRGQLIRQFIGETMILVFIALNLSILTVDSVMPLFNQQFDADIDFSLSDPVTIGGLLAVFVVTSLISGSYPAFFLSSMKAVNIFSKKGGSHRRGGGIRRILVVVQFMFTIIFIITTMVNYRQFKLMKESGMKFDTGDIAYFRVRGDLLQHLPEFRQEILREPSIRYVTGASHIPMSVDRGEFEWGLTADAHNELALILPVNYDFEKTFGIELAAGRFYDESMPGDTAGKIVINQSVADALEMEDPVGQTFYLTGDVYTVIGVIRNYSVSPISLAGDKLILPYEDENPLLFIKYTGTDMQKLGKFLESVHEKFNPDYPFNLHDLSEFMDPITEVLGDFNKIIYFFTLFGILISCMGLLGLSIFSTEQRTKEIGIRKALGASMEKVLRMVTFDFLKLILISLVLAIPISILVLRMLLRLFSERIHLGPGLFLIASLIAILISLLTVAFQAIRSARSNPANSLRYE